MSVFDRLRSVCPRDAALVSFLVMSTIASAQQGPGRPEVFRPPQNPSHIKAEVVNGRPAVAGEVLFRFKDEFLANAVQQRMVSTLSELRQGVYS